MAKKIIALGSEKYADFSGVRVQDVLAKASHVSAKQTARVLKALQVVCPELGIDYADVIEAPPEIEQPTAVESALCDAVYDQMDVSLSSAASAGHPFDTIWSIQ